ncbi:MAG: glycine oxidase ThiO [Bacteroidota bacterium]
MTATPPPSTEVAVVGGGVVGLALAWRLAERGRRVTVLEREAVGRGASYAAAGMLAPAAEIQFEEADLYRLGRESLRRWPAFARDLEAASGIGVDYRGEGTLVVADDRDAAEALRRLYRFQQDHGVPVEWLTGAEAREIEPMLSPRLAAAVHSPEDHQVDNRRVLEALRVAAERAGVTVREQTPVRAVEPNATRPAVVTGEGERIEASAVVLAAGAWVRSIDGIEPAPPVRPVKGQMLSLQMERPFELRHVVRGPDAYLVPKSDGRLVVGATSEEQGFDTALTAGGLYRLLEAAVEVVPGIEELKVTETWAGLRPASRDHAPLIGTAAPGVVLAAGHYRHGVLLTPVTAAELALDIDSALAETTERGASGYSVPETSEWLAPFAPARFDPAFPDS